MYRILETMIQSLSMPVRNSSTIVPCWSVVLLVCGVLGWGMGEARSQDKPQFSRLEPYGATIGETSTLEAIGASKNGAWNVWCSDLRVQWNATEKPGVFEVIVPKDVAPGAVWFRFFNDRGATSAKRLLLTTNLAIRELEPNDRWNQSGDVVLDSECVYGTLDKNGDVDHYRLNLKAGEMVFAALDSVRWLRAPLDANLQLLDSRGIVVAENMDHFGLDPGLDYLPPVDGVYYVRVLGFPVEPNSTISFHGGPDWCYRLRVGKGGLPMEPEYVEQDKRQPVSRVSVVSANANEIANAISIPNAVVMSGAISQDKQTHYFRLTPFAGKTVNIQVIAQMAGSRLDPILSIVDSQGKRQAFQDDNNTVRDPVLQWRVPAENEYFASITDFHRTGSEKHVYWLRVDEVTPGIHAKTTIDSLAAKVSEDIEIPIQWERIADWTGEVEIERGNLPEGTIIENSRLTLSKDGPKASTLKIKLNTPYQGPLRLLIRGSQTGVGDSTIPLGPVELEGPTLAGCWLTVYP